MSCSEGCLASSLSYLLSWKPAVTIYLVVCLRVGPTRIRTKKVWHTISGLKCGIRRTPPTFFRSPKKHVGGIYISRGQVKYFSEISCLTTPKYSRVKGGGC